MIHPELQQILSDRPEYAPFFQDPKHLSPSLHLLADLMNGEEYPNDFLVSVEAQIKSLEIFVLALSLNLYGLTNASLSAVAHSFSVCPYARRPGKIWFGGSDDSNPYPTEITRDPSHAACYFRQIWGFTRFVAGDFGELKLIDNLKPLDPKSKFGPHAYVLSPRDLTEIPDAYLVRARILAG